MATDLTKAMDATVDASLRAMLEEVHQFVAGLRLPRGEQEAPWRLRARQRCHELRQRAAALRERVSTYGRDLDLSFDGLSQTLHDVAAELADKPSVKRLSEIRRNLAERYEEIVAQVSAVGPSDLALARLRSIRLPKAARSLFHLSMGLVAVFMYQVVLSRTQALYVLFSFLAVFTGLEIGRRFSVRFNDFLVYRVFGLIVRPRERYRINSATYYLAGLTFITLVAPKVVVCAAILALAIGDPLAALAGSRFGRLRIVGEKTLIGSMAFLLSAFLAVSGYLLLFSQNLFSPAMSMLLAATISLVGTLAELFSGPLDDNFAIPVASALAGTGLLLLF
jgi:dolichol kinase